MRRVDGDAGNLQRGEGLITRPLPLLLWIDGSEQPHVQQLAYQTAADARARTTELVASLQQQIVSGNDKQRKDGSAEQPPAKKAKKESAAAKKKKKQRRRGGAHRYHSGRQRCSRQRVAPVVSQGGRPGRVPCQPRLGQ